MSDHAQKIADDWLFHTVSPDALGKELDALDAQQPTAKQLLYAQRAYAMLYRELQHAAAEIGRLTAALTYRPQGPARWYRLTYVGETRRSASEPRIRVELLSQEDAERFRRGNDWTVELAVVAELPKKPFDYSRWQPINLTDGLDSVEFVRRGRGGTP